MKSSDTVQFPLGEFQCYLCLEGLRKERDVCPKCRKPIDDVKGLSQVVVNERDCALCVFVWNIIGLLKYARLSLTVHP